MKALLIAFLILITPSVVQAQVTPDISLTTIPVNPGPGETVQVYAESYSFDLNQTPITWKYNGVTVASGVGKTSITVSAPEGGVVGILTATAVNPLGNAVATLALRPASIDLLWEAADAYTPPFYKGKALPIPNSTIKMTAVPAYNSPKNVSYEWSRNGSALPLVSGYNKSSMLFKHSELNTVESISVIATGGAFRGSSTASISPRSPSLVGYSRTNGFINYANGSTTGLETSAGGMIVRFEPYFFSVPTSVSTDLQFSVQGEGVDTSEYQSNEIPFSRPESGAGKTTLSINVHTNAYSLQHLKRLFNISFY